MKNKKIYHIRDKPEEILTKENEIISERRR